MKATLLFFTFLFTYFSYAQENNNEHIDSTQITLIGNKLYKAHQGYSKANGHSIKYTEIDISNVLFKTSQSELLPSSYSALNSLAVLLKDNPKIRLMIEGHTDIVGHSRSNLKLSIRRARAIKLYLFNKGIKLDRITANGFGDQSPICETPCAENQRVEFALVTNGNERRLVVRKAERIALDKRDRKKKKP